MDIALLTYNTIVLGVENGWHDSVKEKGNRLLLLQKQPSAVSVVFSGSEENRGEVSLIIRALWDALLVYHGGKGIDKVFIYLGGAGAEEFIRLVAASPEFFANQEKIHFLICPCKRPEHEGLIKQCGLDRVQIIPADCSGVNEMRQIYYHFLGKPNSR